MRFVVAVLVLAGCATVDSTGDPLSGTRWSLVSIGGSPVLVSESTSMQFDKGRLTGSDGCNALGGKFKATAAKISTNDLGPQTAIGCNTSRKPPSSSK